MAVQISGRDIQGMIRHWLQTPVNSYLGSDYGQDNMSLLQIPLMDSTAADDYISKLREAVECLRSVPEGYLSLERLTVPPDKAFLMIDVLGQKVLVKEVK